MKEKPHIIIFNPDEMRASTLAHLGNPAAVTPNLDSFAENDAVSFGNAYCQNPVCVPSRCSFFTGLYPHTTGHRTMSYLLRPGEPSLLSELREAGYHVWMNDRNDLCASQYPGWVESHADEIFYPGNVKQAPGPVNPGQRGEPGGKFYYSHYVGELKTDENGLNYNTDDETVDAAINRLSNWKEGEKPLCMFLGLHDPHTPYQVEEPYFSAIERAKLPKRIKATDCVGKSKMMELYRDYQNLQDLTEEEWDELRAVYQGMCMKVDVQFGRLCEGLKKAGIYDNSAIFVLSDHGDYAGDYGMAEKAQNCFEDCLTKVPFLIKPPKGTAIDPGVSESLVELVDFYATALDFANVSSSHTHFGKSLRAVLADRSESVREYAFCEGGRLPGESHCDEYHQEGGREANTHEEYWPKKVAQLDDEAHAKAIMIRGKRYKYISRSAGKDELYDLVEDPNETTNCIDKPELAEELQTLQLAMMKWLQNTSDIVPKDYDRRFTTDSLMSKVDKIIQPEDREKVIKFIESGATIGEVFGYAFRLQRKE